MHDVAALCREQLDVGRIDIDCVNRDEARAGCAQTVEPLQRRHMVLGQTLRSLVRAFPAGGSGWRDRADGRRSTILVHVASATVYGACGASENKSRGSCFQASRAASPACR